MIRMFSLCLLYAQLPAVVGIGFGWRQKISISNCRRQKTQSGTTLFLLFATRPSKILEIKPMRKLIITYPLPGREKGLT